MRSEVYLYSEKETMTELGKNIGLVGKALQNFKKYALHEVKFELEVNKDSGEYNIISVNNLKLEKLKKRNYIAYFDGACKPNPGERKTGCLIKDSKGNIIFKNSKNMGFGTNNESEYLGLLEVIKKIVNLNIQNVKIMGDSQLVVNQILGVWKCDSPTLRALNQQVHIYLSKIPNWTLKWVRREENQEADLLSN